jgi:hypothetical protein
MELVPLEERQQREYALGLAQQVMQQGQEPRGVRWGQAVLAPPRKEIRPEGHPWELLIGLDCPNAVVTPASELWEVAMEIAREHLREMVLVRLAREQGTQQGAQQAELQGAEQGLQPGPQLELQWAEKQEG